MSETSSLIKANPLLPAEDYAAMRSEGLKSIEKLGSDIWTDYNTSDPGITILEAVTYAITDLAYRTGFEVKDLLAPEHLTEDTWKQVFYTARKILHNNPVTLIDYRKLLVDIKGVRNAWIEPSKEYEVPLWIDYNYFEKRKDDDCSCKDAEQKTCFGKIDLEAATEEKTKAFIDQKRQETQTALDKANAEKVKLQKQIDDINTQLSNETDPLAIEQLTIQRDALVQQMQLLDKTIAGLGKDLLIINAAVFTPSKIVELEGLYNVMIEYEENVIDEERRENVRLQVVEKLAHHRNLCEDFLTVDAVEYVDYGIGASVVLEEYADPDVVLAQIFFTIYKYFSPSVPFNTVQQLLEKGYDIDEIFEGPALKHGFIETTAIATTDFFRDIRLSDIINELVDLNGVKAITYLHLPFIGFDDDSSGKRYFDEWVLQLKEERKIARIQPTLSQVIFCKERDLITYNVGGKQDRRPERMLKFFKDLKVAERKYKLEGTPLDFPVPNGEYMQVEDYYPVTYSLPMCYGVSDRAGLPADADDKRKAQALQLKGYLLFFEQLLADHLVQLNHLRDLFTFDESVKHTYFNKALTGIDDLKSLLIDYDNHGKNHFDLILKDFTHVLQNLVDPPEVFSRRRNRFLNHFLARFGEDLTEYETLTRWLVPDKVEERLIQDKINILKNGEYYKISTARGKGYDYTSPDFWDTENVSGAERRISRLLGFADVTRRTLVPSFLIIEPVMELDAKKTPVQKLNKLGKPLNVVKLLNPDNNQQVLLTSVEVVEGCCTELLINDILAHADIRSNFKFHDELNNRARKTAGPIGNFWFELWDGPDIETAVLLANSERFDKKDNRDKAYKALEKAMQLINRNEGLHLVEHLLLRPKLDTVLDETNAVIPVAFLLTCLDKCDIGIGLNEGTETPDYRKKVTRIAAEKCYDNMPWILEYYRRNPKTNVYDQSILFQETFTDGKAPVPLKFKRYKALALRIQNLQEFGSERINYQILSNQADEAVNIKYSFIIHGDKQGVLAQSPYVFNKRTAKQIKDNVQVADDIEIEIAKLMNWFAFEMDWYCDPDPCDNNEDPYSFRATAVLPCWPKRFRDPTFRNLVEKTINVESPAHVHIRTIWLGLPEMQRFENAYTGWLQEMAQTEMPSYEKVNPLVNVLNTLRPCGDCDDDCSHAATDANTIK